MGDGISTLKQAGKDFFEPADARKAKEAIRKQTQLPILYIINTNYHGDHSFGNQVFKDSHTIIAHENVRKALTQEAGKEYLYPLALILSRTAVIK